MEKQSNSSLNEQKNLYVQEQEDNYFLKKKVTWVWIIFSIFVLTIFIPKNMNDFRFTLSVT